MTLFHKLEVPNIVLSYDLYSEPEAGHASPDDEDFCVK
jgi:hypothetical protein